MTRKLILKKLMKLMKLMTRMIKLRLSRPKRRSMVRVKVKAMKKMPRERRLKKKPSRKNLRKKMMSQPKKAPKEMKLWSENLAPQ